MSHTGYRLTVYPECVLGMTSAETLSQPHVLARMLGPVHLLECAHLFVCSCQSSYSGKRCMFIIGRTQTRIEWEKLIGIGFGVSVLILVLAFIIYCLASKR